MEASTEITTVMASGVIVVAGTLAAIPFATFAHVLAAGES